ncbi:MAG: SAM-dependent methyltransferase [Anaerolineaceae bacterium 4572_78]|nr:MAG: SAM-dependent methyltransferase [Anaerolineaceae bacterium 4572_78]
MANRTINLTEPLYDYMLSNSLREHEVLQQLRQETAQLANATIQISPEQGQFMALLAKLIGAKRAIEIGVFTGYSSLCIALVLPEDGQLTACDINEDWTNIAKKYWQKANVAHKVNLYLAPATETLKNLLGQGQANSYDFAFIDANKTDYDDFYELCLELMRPGGLITIDNMFMHGGVADEQVQDESTNAIRVLTKKLHADSRVDVSIVHIGDGLALVRKR